MMLPNRKYDPSTYLGLLLAVMTDNDAAIEQIMRGMSCEFCRIGMPLVNGRHELLGVVIPCDAEPPTPKVKREPIVFRGRGIKRRTNS